MFLSSELKASPGLLNLTNLLGALDTFDLGASSDEEGKEKAGEVEKRKKKGKGKGAKEEEVPPAAPAPLQRANSLEELVLKVGVCMSERGMWYGRVLLHSQKSKEGEAGASKTFGYREDYEGWSSYCDLMELENTMFPQS